MAIRLGATPSGPTIFYRPDVLPAAQPTVSKHRRTKDYSVLNPAKMMQQRSKYKIILTVVTYLHNIITNGVWSM